MYQCTQKFFQGTVNHMHVNARDLSGLVRSCSCTIKSKTSYRRIIFIHLTWICMATRIACIHVVYIKISLLLIVFIFYLSVLKHIIFILSWFWVLFNVHASIVDIYKMSPIIWKKFQVLSLGLSCKLLAFRKVKSTLIFFYIIYNIWK